jgi:hypothetical protein
MSDDEQHHHYVRYIAHSFRLFWACVIVILFLLWLSPYVKPEAHECIVGLFIVLSIFGFCRWVMAVVCMWENSISFAELYRLRNLP